MDPLNKNSVIITTSSLREAILIPYHPGLLDILAGVRIVQVERDAYGIIKEKVKIKCGSPKLEIVKNSDVDTSSADLPPSQS